MGAAPRRSAEVTPLPAPTRLRLYVGDNRTEELSPVATDEVLNFRTHRLGLILSLVAGSLLECVAFVSGDLIKLAACTVYGITMVGVYASSMLSHAPFSPLWRHRFRTLDQVSIFLFIAGSATPFLSTYLRNRWGMLLLAATWVLALVGVGAKLIVTGRREVPVWYYLLVGWFCALGLVGIVPRMPAEGVALIVSGGLAYSGGTWFLTNDHRAPWYHAIWHVLVMCGTAFQYVVVLRYVLPWVEG